MVPKESTCIKRLVIDLFLAATRFPPQLLQRIPTMVRLMIILSKSNSAILDVKFDLL